MQNDRQQQAQQNHGSNGKIKPEVFALNANVAGQPAEPVYFIVKEINTNTCHQNKGANEYEPFAGIAVHSVKLGGKMRKEIVQYNQQKFKSYCAKGLQNLTAHNIFTA